MNLTRKKARVSLIASVTTALVASGGLLALSAYAAPTPLTLNSGGTSPVVANLGYGSAAAAATAYALKVTGADEQVKVDLVSAPTGGTLAYEYKGSNAAADTSFSTLSIGTADEVQVLAVGAGTTGGNFTITYSGQTTGNLVGNTATAANVQAALEALSNIAVGDVAVTGAAGGPWTVTYGGALGDMNVAQATVNNVSLTGAPAVTNTTSTAGDNDLSIQATASTIDNTYYEYITGDVPGTYTLRILQDTNANEQLDAADERATELITMTVVDAGGTGTTAATTADDVAPAITATTPIAKGLPVTVTIGYTKSLSTSDARGSNVSTSLEAALAARTWIDVTAGTTGVTAGNDNVATYTATTGTISHTLSPNPTGAGTITLRADLKAAAGNNTTSGTKTIEVTDNGTDTVDLSVDDVAGKIKTTGAAVAVKSGQGPVVYEALAMDTTPNPDVPVSGAVVYFSLAGDNVDDLTTNGTAVAGREDVYTATTDGEGIARLTVTSDATDDTDSYTVDADTNGASATLLTATYEDAEVTTIESLNSAAELAPEASTGSVTLKGKLVDQFAGTYQPTSSQDQQVGIQVPDGSNVAFVTPTSGAFSYTYTPTTAPTAGTSLTYDFTYGSLGDGAFTAGTINWASSTAAASITFTTPNADATDVALANHLDATPAQGTGSDDFGDADAEVTGVVRDSSGTALPHKRVTLTASDGVWFSDANTGTDLVETIDVVSDSSGQFDGAFAVFTKSGAATITATAGAATEDVDVTTADPVVASAFKVIAIDADGTPGSTLVVTGKLTDFFGNGVPAKTINLSTGSSTVGSLSDTAPETNSEGVWSTTFISGANQSGEVTLTATIAGQTENEEPIDFWSDADGPGLSGLPEHGEYTDSATITIEEELVTLEATPVVVGGGKAFVSGMTRPNATVEVYIKPVGADSFSLFDVVKADEEGEFGTSKNIVRSTLWLAKMGSISSTVELSSVQSKVTIGARALGDGRVVVAADGAPNSKAALRFYQVAANGKVKLIKSVTANAKGYGSFIWKTTPGTKKIRVYYQAPGTRRGQAEKTQVVT